MLLAIDNSAFIHLDHIRGLANTGKSPERNLIRSGLQAVEIDSAAFFVQFMISHGTALMLCNAVIYH